MSLKGIRQHLTVELGEKDIEVWTRPVDHALYAETAKRHSWPPASDNPVGYLLFLAWSAARRDQLIDQAMSFEKFKGDVLDIAESTEPVDPTPPAAGAG
jgi:hypothetical protein